MSIFTAPHIGACSMGFVMGILVWYFVGRFKEFNSKVLGSTSSVLAGGIVVKAFDWRADQGDALWYYPIGLLIATVLYWLIINASEAGTKFFGD